MQQQLLAALLNQRHADGYWSGELASSALSTATAIAALSLANPNLQDRHRIELGLEWLAAHGNADGGWGDTIRSHSNISTSMLIRAAFRLTGSEGKYDILIAKLEGYLNRACGITPADRAEAIRRRYGRDRTFSVPILTMAALANLVDWHEVPQLPFEMACLPQSWYRFAQLPVVSYALPALIAIGQCVRYHRHNIILKMTGALAKRRSLQVLQRIQPTSGGYLEATPLTSFVVMSLASIGKADHPVTCEGLRFLRDSQRADGSWPIDTDLAIWVTTLAINALGDNAKQLPGADKLLDWLLSQQQQGRHPYTGSPPGGWGWTHFSGSVPDGDDTPGAILALLHLAPAEMTRNARQNGLIWLEGLQNRDGGWPTFCRGWGKLPFDRSGADLTAHALRAFIACHDLQSPKRLQRIEQGFRYLAKVQRQDGSWLPLWFGNQHAPDDDNPVYGTARVLAAYRDANRIDDRCCQQGLHWLKLQQNTDGGWGGIHGVPSSIEETALALEVLAWPGFNVDPVMILKARNYLQLAIEAGELQEPTAIGFYFAKLWYFEKMYPLVWSLSAWRSIGLPLALSPKQRIPQAAES